MNILIFNWRDIKNPLSGGAEILTHEVAKYWVEWGHRVTMFTSSFPGGVDEENIDGIEIIRRGKPDPRSFSKSVYFEAYRYYKKNLLGKYDVVIDEIHGLPFFTPLFVKEKKVVLICELGGILWDVFGPVYAFIGRMIEQLYVHIIYRGTFFMTISNSTKEELVQNGIQARNIFVMPVGVTVPKNVKTYKKEKKPTLIFVARLTKAKGIEDALSALEIIKRKFPDVRLRIIGRGNDDYLVYLRGMVKRLGIEKQIEFCGFVTEEEKFKLMSKAHLLLVPSIKEGWGLTVAEAGIVGTPSITYDVLGLRDALNNNTLGVVVKKNTPEELATETINLLKDKKLYEKLCRKVTVFRENVGWEKSARETLAQLEKVL